MLAPSPGGRPPRQRHPPDPALARGSRTAPPRDRAGGGALGRDDGAHARLPERDLRLLRRPLRRLGAARQRAGRGEPGRLPERDARPRPLDDALDHEPAGRPHKARGRAGRRRGGAAQGRRDRQPHHRARRAHAGDAGAVRRRAARSTRARTSAPRTAATRSSFAIPMGTPGLKFICRDSYSKQRDRVRLPALVALRRDGRGGDLRRRRGPQGSASSWTATPRLLRGHHRHGLARPHHAPGVHARLRQALVRLRPRPHDRQHHRRRAASTTSRRSSARSGTWAS